MIITFTVNGENRVANVAGAFTCRLPWRSLHLAVVDDVMTTGATSASLASSLLAAGARRVDVWCAARARPS